MWATSEDEVWSLELLKKGWTILDWWKRHRCFFSQASRALPLLCNPMWSGGTQGTISTTCPCSDFRNLLSWLPGELRNVSYPQSQKDSGLRQKGSEKLPTLLCLKWKKKICHWSLLVHHCPLQLSLTPLAFMEWDKYRLRVVAPLFLPTQKITFIYCYD